MVLWALLYLKISPLAGKVNKGNREEKKLVLTPANLFEVPAMTEIMPDATDLIALASLSAVH